MKLPIPLLVLLLFYSCDSRQAPPEQTQTQSTDIVKNYLPVKAYLNSEIAQVDSFPLRIMKYHTVNDKTDSALITTKEFDRLAALFLSTELDSTYFENHFHETSFVDRSTELLSFTYSTKDTGSGLKRVDVLLKPVAGINKLNTVYMEQLSANKDSAVIRKLSWKAGRRFSILRIENQPNGKEHADQISVVWDNRD